MLTLYTSLFTLADKDPSTNHYFYMLLMWLSHVKRFAGLTKEDNVIICIDKRTADYGNTSVFLNNLIKTFPCPIQFLLHDPPNTMLEGTLQRYKMFAPFDTLMYLDLDILVIKPLHPMIDNLQSSTLYIHPEGYLHDENYGAYLTSKSIPIATNSIGASSGKFVIKGQSVRDHLFQLILNEAKHNPHTFYTLDQPYYNACFYALQNTINIHTTLYQETLSINLHNFTPKTILIDCMGEPGNGTLHLHKLIGTMTMFV